MADGVIHTRYIDATVTTPAGTDPSAPVKTNVIMGNVVLLEAHVQIPAGHSGLTGWRIDLANVTVVPFGGALQWVIGDDDRLDFTFERIVGLGLQVVTYNLGQYPHTHYCRMKVTDPTPAETNTASSVSIAQL